MGRERGPCDETRLGVFFRSMWGKGETRVRRILILLLTFLGIVFVGSVGAQDATRKKIRIVKYPITAAPDAVGEVRTNEDQKILDDFYKSKVLDDEYQAAVTNDPDIWSRL